MLGIVNYLAESPTVKNDLRVFAGYRGRNCAFSLNTGFVAKLQRNLFSAHSPSKEKGTMHFRGIQ